MRLEKLTNNRIKIHLTFDDLCDRGLTKDDIWKDSIKWQYFFHEMLEEANHMFGIEIQGSVAVEIFSIKAQGMIMILTLSDEYTDEEILKEGFLEMQVSMEEAVDTLFEFADLEDVIQVTKLLHRNDISGGSLYHMNETYFLYFVDIEAIKEDQMVAILSEYGKSSITSIHVIKEYGKKIVEDQVIETFLRHF